MPTGVPFELTPELLADIERMAGQGLSQEQIAHNIGVDPATITRHKKTEDQLRKAIERGQAAGIQQVTNALFNNATENQNLGAQCFYLKNRDPHKWSDRQDIHHSGTVGVFEVIDYTGDDPDDDDEDTHEAA